VKEEHAIFKVGKVDFLDLIFQELHAATRGKYTVTLARPTMTKPVLDKIFLICEAFCKEYPPSRVMVPIKLANLVSCLMARDREDQDIIDAHFNKKTPKKKKGGGRVNRPKVSTLPKTVTPKTKPLLDDDDDSECDDECSDIVSAGGAKAKSKVRAKTNTTSISKSASNAFSSGQDPLKCMISLVNISAFSLTSFSQWST
jgi:hypothetical protein